MKQLTVLATLLAFTMSIQAQTKNFIDVPFVEVSGTADTLVTPNEIFIRIVLSEKDSRDRVSVEELEEKMLAALKDLGLDTEKDLTVSDITSNFKQYLLKSKDIIKAKMYSLKVTNAAMAGKVFIKLEELGISNTSIERVDHSDMKELKNSMRGRAMVDAKERAVALATPLNQTVGSAIHILETDISFPSQMPGRVAGIQIRGSSMRRSNGSDELPQIEFEKIKVTAAVQVKFLLK